MSTGTTNQQGGNRPISDATVQLANDIHRRLVRDLDLPDGGQTAEAGIDQQSSRYPAMLFGALAMHLADVELPATASEADRARAIVEALKRIATSPGLLESITQAPYSTELGGSLSPLAGPERPADERALELQAKVAKAGYFERSMVADNQLVTLRYATLEDIKLKHFRRATLPAGSPVVIKLAPSNPLVWTINLFDSFSNEDGYRKPLGKTRTATYGNIFSLVAAEGESLSKSLTDKVGKVIDIGKVSAGTRLRFMYDFSHAVKEVPGYDRGFGKREYRLPAELKQAYAGDTKDYPLFPGQY